MCNNKCNTDIRGLVPEITSTVKDEFLTPLENVHVYFKSNNNIATTTTSDGNFTLPVLNQQDVLVFSYQARITEIPVPQLQAVTILNTIEELPEVVLTNSKPKNNNWMYWAGGSLLGLLGLVALAKNKEETVKAKL